MLKKINLNKNKRAVSEMVGYVLLISIALSMAAGVYLFIKILPSIISEKADCKEGTSVTLESYSCSGGKANFKIRNNGLHSVNGVIIIVSDSNSNKPSILLKSSIPHLSAGHFQFTTNNVLGVLKPGEEADAIFENEYYDEATKSLKTFNGEIKTLRIQPYIMDKKKIVCTNSVIEEPVDCKINQVIVP